MTIKEREEVFGMFNGHCAYCGCELTMQSMQVDHIEPKRRGTSQEILDNLTNGRITKGKDEAGNYFPSCKACNIRKGTLGIEAFRKELEACHGRMMRSNANYRQLVRFGQIRLVNDGKVEFYYESIKKVKNYGKFI